jgi:4-alpha-glucanotransferase
VVPQPNIPGTIDEHPNWRQRMQVALEDITGAINVDALKAVSAERVRAAG